MRTTADDKLHYFYTLHADFLQSWHQSALSKLEDLCANGSSCSGTGANSANINDNQQVDGLQ